MRILIVAATETEVFSLKSEVLSRKSEVSGHRSEVIVGRLCETAVNQIGVRRGRTPYNLVGSHSSDSDAGGCFR